MRVFTRFLRILSLTTICVACSGGGSSDSPPNPAVTDNPSEVSTAAANPLVRSTFKVTLPNSNGASVETIEIPDGHPVYALLVSGFHQNRNFELFHFYNFAKCLFEKDAYVHYSWWNNLLAPYMERPLHTDASVPSTGPIPFGDILTPPVFPPIDAKAIPNDDFQFQKDALAMLTAIRERNPHAAIVLVGHSMGGDAVARLADAADQAGIEIDLLAPIDPVGNRSCILEPLTGLQYCDGLFNFTRWRATHLETLDTPWDLIPFNPPRRSFSSNIKYLYHRWQQEGMPPFDFSCPDEGSSLVPCLSYKPYYEYLFDHPDQHVESIYAGSSNVQAEILTSLNSGYDVFPPPSIPNSGGWMDGHGEIVGFRGVIPYTPESYPMALKAMGDWPTRLEPGRSESRVEHLKQWEADPNYLRDSGFEPRAPGLCMVSGDLCEILRTSVSLAPEADAGPDQTAECSGPDRAPVTLDGSGSSGSNGNSLTYSWTGPFGTLSGEVVTPTLPTGTHTITLTVTDSTGKSDSDTVVVTIRDSTSPSLSVSLAPNALWPPNHKLVNVTASIQVSDTCDVSPDVELVSILSNEADNGLGDGDTSDDIQGASYRTDDRVFSLRAERSGNGVGRVYTVTYRATDASGHVADAVNEVTVPH